MLRCSWLAGGWWLVACLAGAPLNAAQAPASADTTRARNLQAYVELLRSDIRDQKVALISGMMQFSEEDDAKFWPVYREYEQELSSINDERLALIREYASAYEQMTDQIANRLAHAVLDLEARRNALKTKVLRTPHGDPAGTDRGPGAAGREPDSAPARSADRRGAAGHRVTRRVRDMPMSRPALVAVCFAIAVARGG